MTSESSRQIETVTSKDELTFENNVILWGLRVVILNVLAQRVLQELHYQNPGIVKMKTLSRMYVWFPGIDKEIEEISA